MYRIFLLTLSIFGCLSLRAQITTNPALPLVNQKVTITFDSSKESRLGYYTGDLYAHTGVIVEGKTNWQYVTGNWGEPTQPKLSHKGNGIYELAITPDVRQFYSVPANEKIVRMAFVFRTSNSSKQTDNLFVNVYQEGLNVKITAPAAHSILSKNKAISISASASEQAAMKLYLNENLLAENTGTDISTSYSFAESGANWLIAEAKTTAETKRDSIQIFVRDEVVNAAKPADYRKGINYLSETSAALVLWAPLKKFVYVLGDFNNWKPDNNFMMKKDGDFFWLEIENLEAGKEYAFQYFINGEIKIADPYTEKILDPWNDEYIPAEVYPNLLPYPAGKTEGIVSVLQTAQIEYEWEINDFQIPEKEKLVIYELLVRDFTAEHTFKAVREKLDYLEDLRVNVLELMPVNEFEGNSSWGYNPSFYFAPDKYYGPKNELKKLIDECHKRGIAVVIDMVLNHSYGQSPLVHMYMDNWTITDENPWYNIESPNTSYSWGYDFNHEADAVKQLVDSVNSFWMKEYKADGFRFDFTKGFTNTPGDGWNYDTPRVKILKRMADEIWKRKSDALVIFEHLAENNEEMQLANYGILLWGNLNGNYREAARGNVGGSDLSWGIYAERNWTKPNLLAYPESHDEERIMFSLKTSGYINGDYNIKEEATALKRVELNSVFYLPLPGPKMIWQFGERGYDVSIDEYDGRLGEKPPRWEYLENPNRSDLFQVMAKLNELKQSYPEFTPETFDYSLKNATKWYRLNNGGNHVLTVGNFGTQETTANITFQKTGKWFEFFSRDSIEISSAQQNIPLPAGGYRIYSTRKFAEPTVVTAVGEVHAPIENIRIYPNPTNREINVSARKSISNLQLYSLSGKMLLQTGPTSRNTEKMTVEGLSPGIYLLKVFQDTTVSTHKIVVK